MPNCGFFVFTCLQFRKSVTWWLLSCLENCQSLSFKILLPSPFSFLLITYIRTVTISLKSFVLFSVFPMLLSLLPAVWVSSTKPSFISLVLPFAFFSTTIYLGIDSPYCIFQYQNFYVFISVHFSAGNTSLISLSILSIIFLKSVPENPINLIFCGSVAILFTFLVFKELFCLLRYLVTFECYILYVKNYSDNLRPE